MLTAFLCPAVIFADGEVIFNVHGYFGSVFSSNYASFPVKTGYGFGSKLGYKTTSPLEFSAGVDYLILPRETKTDESLTPANFLRANFGVGFYIPVGERIMLAPGVNAGVYNLKVSGETKSAVSFGGSFAFVYKINPRVSIEIPATSSVNRGIFADVGLAPGISLNLSKLFRDETRISMEVKDVAPVFPVLYSWYEKNPFATVSFMNEEEIGITDVTVSFYQSQYMTQPKVCLKKPRVESGEWFDAELVAFFNERMLELIERVDAQGVVTVNYSVLGEKKEKSFPITLGIYGRNSMSWDDDRRAAVFVSSKDPAAMLFARHVMSSVRDNVRSGVPLNIQYAMGIFEALDEFGINYVIDPNSSYSDNVGSTSIDFLQFPYQTLMYRGGDCDDLSILTCSLFEAVGINTAFITIPGHIYIAFDSGIKAKDASRYFGSIADYIVSDGEVWVPLEITLSDEGYTKAWRVGAREWHSAERMGDANLYKMHDSWELYRPVGIAAARVKFELPERKQILTRFSDSVDYWIQREIEPQVRAYKQKLAKGEDAGVRNDLGILYVRYGLFDDAEKQFKIARQLNNKNAILNTAGMYFAKEQYENSAYMYRQIVSSNPKNTLAYLGLARCAYELGDYKTCDDSFEIVRSRDKELASEYAYLGSFETVKGRAFSLSERLENTIWVGSNSAEHKLAADAASDYYLRTSKGLNSIYIASTPIEYKVPEREKKPVQKEVDPLAGELAFAAGSSSHAKTVPSSSTSVPSVKTGGLQKVIVLVGNEPKQDEVKWQRVVFKNPLNESAKKSGKKSSDKELSLKDVIMKPVYCSGASVGEFSLFPAPVPGCGKIRIYHEKNLVSGAYYVQIASFRTVGNAIKMVENYPQLKVVECDGYYRILSGAYSEDEARAVMNKFTDLGFTDSFVRKIR